MRITSSFNIEYYLIDTRRRLGAEPASLLVSRGTLVANAQSRARKGADSSAMLVARRWWSRIDVCAHAPRASSSVPSAVSWVLHRDDDVLVLDKPPGVPMRSVGSVLGVDAVLSDLKFDLRHPPMTVHRLDRDTTGCLILARTHEAQRILAGYLQDRARAFSARDDSARTLGDIRRVYWALVSANKSTLAPRGTVDAPLVTTHAGVTLKPGADAKPAATDYEIIAESNVEPTSAGRSPVVLALRPRTGRKHQLRVHCAGVLDAAIVGDYKYGYKDVSRTGRIADDWRRTLRDVDAEARMNDAVRAERVRRGSGSDETCLEGVPLHLHAREVEFLHPTSGKMVRVVAPVPPHVSAAFQALSLALDNG